MQTVRTWVNDGLPLREARDADIEKAAEEEPDNKGAELEDAELVHLMSIRFDW
jgi:hypothetical protein